MNNKSNELFTTMPVGRAIAKPAVPTVVSQIIVILYSLVDTFFVGQLNDPNQVAALSITFPIYTLLTAVANLFGIGANSMIARSLRQNDRATARRASAFSFWASLGVTAVLAVILGTAMKPILLFFGAEEATFSYTANYLLWVFAIGGIPTVAGLVLGHLVRSVGKTREAGIGLTIGGVMNIILDPIFIFSKGDKLLFFEIPFGFGMDVAGAGFATMISNVISMIYFFVILFRMRKSTVLTLSPRQFTMQKKISWGIFSVGFPAAIAVVLVSFSVSLLNGLLLTYDNGVILSAAYGVTSKCGTIALHISIGIAQGVMPLIGYSIGAKDHNSVHDVCRLSFLILLVFSVVFLVIVQLIPGTIVRLFIEDEATVAEGTAFMRCWSWCVIGMSLFNMYNTIFQAVGKWKISLLLAVLRMGVIFSVLCLVLNALFGQTGLMWVQAITDTLSCLIAPVLYEQFKRSLRKQTEPAPATSATAERVRHRIIAISREFGSGGRTIGKEVAAKLGIPCYDSELIGKIAEESGLAREYIEQYSEEAASARSVRQCIVFPGSRRTFRFRQSVAGTEKSDHGSDREGALRDCGALRRLYSA